MSEENVERVKRGFDAFMRGDMAAIADFIDPSFEIDDRVVPEANPSERGIDALVADAARVYEVFGEVSWEPREILDFGDRVLVRVHVSMAGKHTALPVEEDIGHLYALNQGGRVVKLDIYRTWEEAREAAGLSE
jgi:ketosteroid isomerase-like protein